MSIQYQVSTWFSLTSPEAMEFAERKRLDAALQELWRQIYEMLKGSGMLDTERAWTLRKEWQDYCEKLTREGLRPGHFRRDEFLLRSNDRLGQKVLFRQSRIGR